MTNAVFSVLAMASRLQTLRPLLNQLHLRQFITSTVRHEKPLPPRIVIPDSDLEESFLKGSGPGGQKINKTSSAVQLKHIPTGMVVKSQETRSRQQNRKIARRLLSDKLENLEKGDESRQAIKAKEASRKKASKMKKSRRKYRKLEEAKSEVEESPPAIRHQEEEEKGMKEELNMVESADHAGKAS